MGDYSQDHNDLHSSKSSRSMLRVPVFGVPLINYDLEPFEDHIQTFIEAKKMDKKFNNPLASLFKDLGDDEQPVTGFEQKKTVHNPWLKLSSMIFSPIRKLGEFEQYVN